MLGTSKEFILQKEKDAKLIRSGQPHNTLMDHLKRIDGKQHMLVVAAPEAPLSGACGSTSRQLGAKAIMTGIRPDVADQMVELAADLRRLVMLDDLKSGIAHAIAR